VCVLADGGQFDRLARDAQPGQDVDLNVMRAVYIGEDVARSLQVPRAHRAVELVESAEAAGKAVDRARLAATGPACLELSQYVVCEVRFPHHVVQILGKERWERDLVRHWEHRCVR
jgi:hypothetical protein